MDTSLKQGSAHEAVRAFIGENGTPGLMPTIVQLRGAGREDVVRLVRRAGGQALVAEELGLRVSRGLRRRSSQAQPSPVERRALVTAELMTFINDHGTTGHMPSATLLAVAKRHDLAWALRREFGGMQPAAAALGLRTVRSVASRERQPRGHWQNWTVMESAVRAFIAENGTAGVMPSQSMFRAAGRFDIVCAMQRHHGGLRNVSARLRLPLSTGGAVHGDKLADGRALGDALRAFAASGGSPGRMPTQVELQTCGRYDLVRAIHNQGGMLQVSASAGLDYVSARKRPPPGYWQSTQTISQELLEFIRVNGTQGVMPSRLELAIAGQRRLLSAIDRHCGSLEHFALELGLSTRQLSPEGVWVIDTTLPGKPRGKWIPTKDAPIPRESSASTQRSAL